MQSIEGISPSSFDRLRTGSKSSAVEGEEIASSPRFIGAPRNDMMEQGKRLLGDFVPRNDMGSAVVSGYQESFDFRVAFDFVGKRMGVEHDSA